MLDKMITGWKVQEAQEGLAFEHFCRWDTIPTHMAAGKLKNFSILGMFEDAGTLYMMIKKDGNYRLLRIMNNDEGYQIISIMPLAPIDFSRILKAYCDPDKPEKYTGQIIE